VTDQGGVDPRFHDLPLEKGGAARLHYNEISVMDTPAGERRGEITSNTLVKGNVEWWTSAKHFCVFFQQFFGLCKGDRHLANQITQKKDSIVGRFLILLR